MSDNQYEFDDPIFDVMLEELLGDAVPRDMSADIMAKLDSSELEVASQISIAPRRQTKRTLSWAPLSFALSAAACILTIIAFGLNSNTSSTPQGDHDLIAKSKDLKNPNLDGTVEAPVKQELQEPKDTLKPEKSFEPPKQMIIADVSDAQSQQIAIAELKVEPSGRQHPLAFVSTETINPILEKEILDGIAAKERRRRE